MTVEQRIYVNNDLDVVVARMQAREMAKQMGFGTADQARISLAASELARVLSWHNGRNGEIVLSTAVKDGQQGLQINCSISPECLTPGSPAGRTAAPCQRNLAGACQLVDESKVEVQSNKYTRVTLFKWLRGKEMAI
jgi:serine/threonine-protein kinase RsbT